MIFAHFVWFVHSAPHFRAENCSEWMRCAEEVL